MSEPQVNLRKERIQRLLQELRYEVERGMMEGEVEEELGFVFIVPMSKQLTNGVVWCEFRTRPTLHHNVPPDYWTGPKLRVVGK